MNHASPRRPRRTTEYWIGSRGAIDLASIMVGVLVMGILGSVIAASVFTVIPWSQDNAAKTNAREIGTAQGVSFAMDQTYRDYPGLVTKKFLGASTTSAAGVNAAGTCFVAATKSATGKVYVVTSDASTPVLHDGSTNTDWCTPIAGVVAGVGAPAAPATPDVAIAAALAAYRTTNGSYTTSMSALDTINGSPILATGQSAKILLTTENSYNNAVVDGSFEADAAAASRFTPVAGMSFARATDGGSSGSAYVRVTQPTGGALQTNGATLDGAGSTQVIPAVAGKQYTVSARVRSSITVNGTLSIVWKNASNVQIGSAAVTGSADTMTAGAWTTVGGIVSGGTSAPVGATTMSIKVLPTGWTPAGVTMDIDSVSAVIGQHEANVGSPKTFYFPTWFQTKTGGYMVIIRAADGTTTAITNDVATPFPVFNNMWDAPVGGTVKIAAASDFPVDRPLWARQAGFDSEATYDPFRTGTWTLAP